MKEIRRRDQQFSAKILSLYRTRTPLQKFLDLPLTTSFFVTLENTYQEKK
jgi:hypothetical protein